MQTPRNNASVEAVQQRLGYDPDSGSMFWLSSYRLSKIGKVAGYKRKDGYIVIQVAGRLYLVHRLAFVCMCGRWPRTGVDHINGNPGDNRWVNLREADSDQNHWNMKVFANNTSGHRGVTHHHRNGKWVAEIWHKRKKYYLGSFNTKELASDAYEAARSRMFGDFNRLPQEQTVGL